MTLVSKTFELYGKTYTFESGELAKQATGACLVKQGDTTMLDTVADGRHIVEQRIVADEGVFGSLTKVVEMGHGAK